MKFLLDMGLAQSTARQLQAHGHDADHLRSGEFQQLERLTAPTLTTQLRLK